jgi:hypothetical protein
LVVNFSGKAEAAEFTFKALLATYGQLRPSCAAVLPEGDSKIYEAMGFHLSTSASPNLRVAVYDPRIRTALELPNTAAPDRTRIVCLRSENHRIEQIPQLHYKALVKCLPSSAGRRTEPAGNRLGRAVAPLSTYWEEGCGFLLVQEGASLATPSAEFVIVFHVPARTPMQATPAGHGGTRDPTVWSKDSHLFRGGFLIAV